MEFQERVVKERMVQKKLEGLLWIGMYIYRNMTDIKSRSLYDIKCRRQTFDVIRRDGGHVRWGSTRSGGSMFGFPVET